MDKYLPAPISKAKKPRKPRAPKADKPPKPPKESKPKKEKKPPKPKAPPKPKMPEAKFNNNLEFHAYLESLTHPQLKKVATALVSNSKKLLTLDKKASREALLEEIKQTFSYDDTHGLIIPEIGIEKDYLPKQPAPKPKKEKVADRIEPLNEEDYPKQTEISDERIRKQVIGKMRIIEQTNNDIFIIRHKNKLNKTKEPTKSQEDRRTRAEEYIREKVSASLASKLINRAYQLYK